MTTATKSPMLRARAFIEDKQTTALHALADYANARDGLTEREKHELDKSNVGTALAKAIRSIFGESIPLL